MRRRLGILGLAAVGLWLGFGCPQPTAPTASTPETAPAPADPTAGRDKITVYYSGNLWGELLECG